MKLNKCKYNFDALFVFALCLFMFVTDGRICNYADDTSIYVCDDNHENDFNKLKSETLILSEWFQNNYMKLNDDKCHLMISVKRTMIYR